MKAIITFIVITLISLPILSADHAFDKGSIMVSGEISYFALYGDIETEIKMLTFEPKVAYSFGDGFVIGALLKIEKFDFQTVFANQNSSYYKELDSTFTTYGVLIEKYFKPVSRGDNLKSGFFPYISLSATFNLKSDNSNHTICGYAGGIYMLSNQLGLNIGVGLKKAQYNHFSISNAPISFGMNYFVF